MERLVLSNHERSIIMELWQTYCLHEYIPDEKGRRKKKLMRQKNIWINDIHFLKKNKHKKSINNLIEQKVIQAHPIMGFTFKIREEYLHKIYNLADAGNWDLLEQLAELWIEV